MKNKKTNITDKLNNFAIMWQIRGGLLFQFKLPIISNIGNMQAFWGVVKMTLSF